ncbi:hypothetical protein SNOG_00763 [Parastagonospora nodorum SN15]|uniref:Uncharacterized protein n=1 Tax=Phaeosphaeria nodorum (strain SN15 / ATCC MYA-4574 / FGSC 10173) TaxID=321614 RepID=Q0V5F1_PHANO|nr:hypothetical protein SNOG_00763 [Parastagonospora nodorum SN15]EAT92258.1 hypothetical protein SNOG_00763 [Parastagonospora nodorum SN15]
MEISIAIVVYENFLEYLSDGEATTLVRNDVGYAPYQMCEF